MMTVVPRHRMVLGSLLTVWAALSAPGAVAEPEFDRGRALYENHCEECHESWAHTRDGSRVNTIEDLRRWTQAWSMHSKLDWSDDEINDVADYLNREYYHLTDKP
jgi:mono/diheme cytochrome c family protein